MSKVLKLGITDNNNKKIIEVKHNADLVQSKYELESKHFNEIKNRNTDDKTQKEQQLEKLNLDKKDYLEKIQKLDSEYKQLEEQTIDTNDVVELASDLGLMGAGFDINAFQNNVGLLSGTSTQYDLLLVRLKKGLVSYSDFDFVLGNDFASEVIQHVNSKLIDNNSGYNQSFP